MLFIAVMFMALTGFGKDIKTLVVITTPQMHCESCENKIKNNLRFEKGIKSIETDIPSQTVTIVYDADKTTEQEILAGFQKFNYSARKVNRGEHVEMQDGGSCENM